MMAQFLMLDFRLNLLLPRSGFAFAMGGWVHVSGEVWALSVEIQAALYQSAHQTGFVLEKVLTWMTVTLEMGWSQYWYFWEYCHQSPTPPHHLS